MLIIKAILLCITIYLACFLAGSLLVSNKPGTLGKKCVTGLMILWASFYIPALLFILMQPDTQGFTVKLKEAEFWGSNTLTMVYLVLMSLICFLGSIKLIADTIKTRKTEINKTSESRVKLEKYEIVYLGLFLGLVLFQLVKSILYMYADGDDSYYVSVAQIMATGENTMYQKDPYNGYPSELQLRYAFAPFPIWIGFFARIFSLNAAIVSHVCMPVVLIPITYVIYSMIGDRLFDNKGKKYMFLCLIAVFVLFSHYSYGSAEVFLLTRARQGKEVLANIIIPFLFYMLMEIASEDEWKIDIKNYITIIFIATSAALSSAFGNLLVLIMLFGNFLYGFYRRGKIKYILMSASLAIPGLCILALYYLL